MIVKHQEMESIVFINEQFSKLRFKNIVPNSLTLFRILPNRQISDEQHSTDYSIINYDEIEYTVLLEEGMICRKSSSTIPNWADHCMFNLEQFNHIDFADYSNDYYTLYVSYQYEVEEEASSSFTNKQGILSQRMQALLTKLKEGRPIHYVIMGDSISTGAEATLSNKIYYNDFTSWLAKKTGATFTLTNKAIGGETSRDGCLRFASTITPLEADLVTIAYGMNDQNLYDFGVAITVNEYKQNLMTMIEEVLEHSTATPILIAGCTPNPKWIHTSGQSHLYANAVYELGEQLNIAIIDVYSEWMKEIDAGKSYESLLLNNINHPNNYGHHIYAKAVKCFFENLL